MIPRIIARLDVKRDRVVKGISMQGERPIGDPHEVALARYADGADELMFVDTYASLVRRNSLGRTIESVADDVFVPRAVSGGIRSIKDVRQALRHGADRVGVNTAAIQTAGLLRALSAVYGASTLFSMLDVVSEGDTWTCLTEYGREPSGFDAIRWAYECAESVGEIVVTSVSCDGRQGGPDRALVQALAGLPCPLTYSGGIRNAQDICDVLDDGADAVAIGAALHFGGSIAAMKQEMTDLGRKVRVHEVRTA